MVFCMGELVIVVGRDMLSDLRRARESSGKHGLYKSALYVKDAAQAMDLLSKERLRLLKQIIDYKPSVCVSDLVKSTGRKQEAISRDASILESRGAIAKKKKGRKVYLKPKIDSIRIKFG